METQNETPDLLQSAVWGDKGKAQRKYDLLIPHCCSVLFTP